MNYLIFEVKRERRPKDKKKIILQNTTISPTNTEGPEEIKGIMTTRYGRYVKYTRWLYFSLNNKINDLQW